MRWRAVGVRVGWWQSMRDAIRRGVTVVSAMIHWLYGRRLKRMVLRLRCVGRRRIWSASRPGLNGRCGRPLLMGRVEGVCPAHGRRCGLVGAVGLWWVWRVFGRGISHLVRRVVVEGRQIVRGLLRVLVDGREIGPGGAGVLGRVGAVLVGGRWVRLREGGRRRALVYGVRWRWVVVGGRVRVGRRRRRMLGVLGVMGGWAPGVHGSGRRAIRLERRGGEATGCPAGEAEGRHRCRGRAVSTRARSGRAG